MGRSRIQVVSRGFDPFVQGMGSDPNGSTSSDSILIPYLATPDPLSRYTFQLATMQVRKGECVYIVGLQQSLRIGLNTNAGGIFGRDNPIFPSYPLTQTVSGAWRFVDGNVSWHLRFVKNPPTENSTWSPLNTASFQKWWAGASGSALLFDSASFNEGDIDYRSHPSNYLKLTGYTPPSGGVIPGEPIGSSLGTWNSIRFPGNDPSRQSIDPICVKGPGYITLFASVFQPSKSHATTISVPTGMPLPPSIPEEAFLSAYPTSQYWDVGGGFIVERAT